MLDPKFVRENIDLMKDVISKRNLTLDLDAFVSIDEQRRSLMSKKEILQAERNSVSKLIPTISNPEERQSQVAKMKEVKASIESLDSEQKEVEEKYFELLYQIPNTLSETAAIGNDEDSNSVESVYGAPTQFDFEPRAHHEIGEKQGWIDTKRGSEVSGARFWYLKGELVRLQFALVQYAFDVLTEKGFTEVLPPFLVREKAMFGTGFFPAEKNEIYSVNPGEDDLYLIGTSEVPLTSYHAGEILDISDPIKYVGYSSCFRREAGSSGKDTVGILRGHQFDKIEMVTFCKPEESESMHESMIAIEEEVWQGLRIPYQKMNVCSGDLGNPAMKKYDLEAWIPTQETYREVTSCSNIGSYQSSRLGIRYRDEDDKTQSVHTLNGTVIAIGRCLIAIIENYQNEDGTVEIPEILQSYMGGKESIGAPIY